MSAAVTERTVTTPGAELHVVDAGERSAGRARPRVPRAVATRGATRCRALADAGYRVLAPDQRGYGRSSPTRSAVEDYDILALTGDLLALLDDVGEEQAVFVGHDWGAMVVWQLALLAPGAGGRRGGDERPVHAPRADAADRSSCARCCGDSCFYILYFQEPGVADADLGARSRRPTMRRLLAAPPSPRRAPSSTRRSGDRRPRASSTASRSPTACPTG